MNEAAYAAAAEGDADLLAAWDARTCQKSGFKASPDRFSLSEASVGMD